ncbi:MAG: phosphatidylserine decarboxylase family protein [Ignavibacteriaceae bacterium]|nr:phosphatidylserine decarboxylase family protein [Ignavibacteriaceae bacterium]
MLAKYGYSTIGVVAIISFILIAAGILINNGFVKYSLITLAILLIIFTLNFFRDPERKAPDRDDVVVSPAEGKVLFIKEIVDNKFLNDKAKMISVFMSPLNVHVNRIPIDGTVDFLEYHKGEYIAAFEDKASEVNERSEIGITSKHGKVLFTQVAGFVARRIVYDLSIGDTVKMGERFGMIKFGSRVDVIVPLNWTPKVKQGDKVSAGETILFEVN